MARSRPDQTGGAAWVAFIRGINVGRAKRVAMADLRRLLEDLGARDVRTVLNSGNAVYNASKPFTAAALEKALEERTGVRASVVLIDAAALAKIAAKNPLTDAAGAKENPGRLHVGFYTAAGAAKKLSALARRDWSPEALAMGREAVYLWCPNGMANSDVVLEVGRTAGKEITFRNWSTVQKILSLASAAATPQQPSRANRK